MSKTSAQSLAAGSPPVEKLGGGPHSKNSLRVWLKLLSCTATLEKSLRSRFQTQFDTTLPRFDVMSALDRHPDGLTMSELSAMLMVSNGNSTGIVKRLEEEGLVQRASLEHDRRTSVVRLTDKGTQAFRDMAKHHESWIDALFGDLSTEEIEALMALIDKVRASAAHHLD